MGNQKGGSKTDTIIKLVLVFFISLLSFSVGTYVGKQVSDSDSRRASLEQDYKSTRDVASEEAASPKEDEKNISEDDIKSLTDEFVQSEKEKPTETNSATEPSVDGYKKVVKNETVTQAATKVANNESPTHDEPTERKPNSIMPTTVASSAVGKFTVQVASFADEDEAKSQAASLKDKGWNAFYVPADIKGHTWFRVSVGLFTSAKSATLFREKFMKEANMTSVIVQKIVQ